jgi:glycosyltransferase involved in cell wall biosynthesis
MLISFLLPTRGRKDMFIKSINSLISNSSEPNCFEVLAGVDYDDFETTNQLKEYYNNNPNIKFFEFERQYYLGFHNYINTLLKQASGKWVCIWNDDIVMTSSNWDTIIEEYKDQFICINPLVSNMAHYCRSNDYPFLNLAPITPKIWHDFIGYYSLNAAVDSWTSEVAGAVGINIWEDRISMVQNRFDVDGTPPDETYERKSQDTEAIRNGFYSWQHIADRYRDKIMLEDLINHPYREDVKNTLLNLNK